MKLLRYGCTIERLGDRYRLEGMLGSGGMADVCLAWDEREQREVAIKIIKVDSLDQKALDRFQKEAAAVVGWDHPHILRIYDDLKWELVDAAHGSIVPYMVMEYAQGGDLHKRLRSNQPYPLEEALHLFGQLCSAVQYAHEHGVIHRDLKPLNILFRVLPNGKEQAVLSDFGLAVQTNATHHTFANAGTLAYMAPEQLQGHSTVASDIFALGVILYQLCTGKLPFRRSLQDLRSGSFTEMPPLPSTINPQLPEALDEVILVALAEEQAKRYADATQFWEAVQNAMNASTIPDPVAMAEEADDEPTQPARKASQYPAKAASAVQIPATSMVEPPAMPVSNFVDFVPTPVENADQRSQYTPVIDHVPTAKLEEAGHDSSIRYVGNDRESVLEVPDSVVVPRMTDRWQNTHVSPPVPLSPIPEPVPSPANVPPGLRRGSSGSMAAVGAGAATPKRGGDIGSGAGTPPPSRRRKGGAFWLLALVALLLLSLLVVGSFAFFAPNSPLGSAVSHIVGGGTPNTTVTIIPASQNVNSNFAILTVTGTPNSDQRQVQARELTYTTPVQSRTVNATGVVTIPAKQAQGFLTFYNVQSFSQTVGAGTVFNVHGVQIVNNGPAVIPAANLPTLGSVTVAAHAITVGAVGNIAAGALSEGCCVNGVDVKNVNAFTGGQDTQHTTFVQQSDIDSVANPLVSPAASSALTAIKALRHTNEQFVGQPQCTPNVRANTPVGSRSPTVTVSVSATCAGEVYDQSATIALADSSLQNQASKIPGTSYKLVGKIATSITKIVVVDMKGTISLEVNAAGIWEYNFTPALKTQLAKLIAGKSQSAAQGILATQTGVAKVGSISIPSGGTTLPTDATQITIVVQDVVGLSGTPAVTGSPTIITPTVGPGTPQPGSG